MGKRLGTVSVVQGKLKGMVSLPFLWWISGVRGSAPRFSDEHFVVSTPAGDERF